jgi:PilZ domain
VFEAKIETSEPESAGRRKEQRDSFFLSATVRRECDGERELAPVRVRNLSGVGLMADYCDVVAAGEGVIVTLRGVGSVSGRVAWVKKNRVGIAFDVEVNPRLARKPVIAGPPPPLPKQRPL